MQRLQERVEDDLHFTFSCRSSEWSDQSYLEMVGCEPMLGSFCSGTVEIISNLDFRVF